MSPLPLIVATSLLRCSFLALSTYVVPTPAQLQINMGLEEKQVVEGSDLVIPAWYSVMPEESGESWEVLSAIWYLQHVGKEPVQVLAYIQGTIVNKDQRVALVYPMPTRNVSLQLRGLQEKDSGSYYCSVNVKNRASMSTEHATSHPMELNVLVPPAPPSCRVMGTPREGTNVSLICKTPRSKPAGIYDWKRLPPNTEVFFPPIVDTFKGFLNLTSLSSSMSGVYTCKVHNEVGSSSCNVTLEVITGPESTVVAGAIVGTLLGLALLAGLVLLFRRRRQNKGVEESANDIKEDAMAPRTLPWSKAGSDTISKNGTLSSVTSARALRSTPGPSRQGAMTPTPSLSSQALSSPKLPSTDGAHQQPAAPPGSMSSSALSRMGAVPVMVPAQSQAGSLV